MTCLQMILARQRGRAWTVVRQPRESQMGESNLDNQQYPPIRKSRHTKAECAVLMRFVISRKLAVTVDADNSTGISY